MDYNDNNGSVLNVNEDKLALKSRFTSVWKSRERISESLEPPVELMETFLMRS